MNIWNKSIQNSFDEFCCHRYNAIKARFKEYALKLPSIGDSFGFPIGQRTRIMNEVGDCKRRIENRVVDEVWDIITGLK
jgi:hypothetical protein